MSTHSSVPAPSVPIEGTFCFVDMAGFTALTEAHGDQNASDLAGRFADLARASLGPEDRLIKTIGDAVLVTCPNPDAGISFVARLFEHTGADPGFPALRAGLHHGPGVARDGDVFGASVNLAARIAGRARSGELAVTAIVAEVARSCGLAVTDVGSCSFKNVRDPVNVFTIDLASCEANITVDPVCRMRIDRRDPSLHIRHDETDYWFCAAGCAAAFTDRPEAYAISKPAL